MKVCSKCGVEKPKVEFSRDAGKKDRLRCWCKPCSAKYQATPAAKAVRAAYAATPVGIAASAKAAAKYDASSAGEASWRRNNASAGHKLSLKKYYAANKNKRNALHSKWVKAHPAKIAAKGAKREAAKLRATPAWANQKTIAEVYDRAVALTLSTGVKHHVDHIVPLRSAIVSGLHVEFNLRPLPSTDNLSKGNRYWPDMPT